MSSELREVDGVPITRTLRPSDAAQVAEGLAEVRRQGEACLAVGGGSKLHWGNRAQSSGLVALNLKGLAREPELRAEEGIVKVSAGLTVAELHRATEAAGKRTSLCTLHVGATVGGTIASDPIDPEFSLARSPRNDVLGLQVAHPNGELTQCGGDVVKNVTGFDLARLYCGSFGTLGVITQVTLRLRPVPEARSVMAADFATREAALEALAKLQEVRPSAVLMNEDPSIRLLWVLEGSERDVQARATTSPGERIDPSEWEALSARLAEAPPSDEDRVRVRVGGRASDTLDIWNALSERAGSPGPRLVLPIAGVVLADIPFGVAEELFADATAQGWMVFMEHANPEQKSNLDVFGPKPESLELMRLLKQRFDPGRVLAPGRFIGGI